MNLTLDANPQLSEFVKKWKLLGKEIKTLKDLISCYYSGLEIVCIPHNKIALGPFLIERYEVLYEKIKFAADMTKMLRQQRGLLWDWHQLDMYLGYAFDHFSRDPIRPFNFLNAGFNHSPIWSTFQTHILAAANRIKDQNREDVSVNIFRELAPLIASSILLDVCRKKLPHNRMPGPILVPWSITCWSDIDADSNLHWVHSQKMFQRSLQITKIICAEPIPSSTKHSIRVSI